MKRNRILSLLLALTMLMGILSVAPMAQAEEAVADTITIIACSDFQNESGSASGKVTVENILSAMANDGVTSADGFLCCGDYDYEYDDTKGGIDTLTEALSDVVTDELVFVKGNHDSAAGTNGICLSGDNDPASGAYGVFAINESDYMWYNSDETTIKATAQNLIEYLNEKLVAGYDKPIFVVSHLPLHYNMRTKNDGDGKHANYIFDVLNEAGAKGLNIIFMFGHNHSNGWDDYLGGSCIYLEKGDKILIAQNSTTVFEEETLNFTYMNPGYVGYYRGVNDGSERDLTMSAFEITGSRVTITRYSAGGVHDLKSVGVTNSYKNETAYSPNTEVYASPKTVHLTSVTDSTPIEDIIEKVELPEEGSYALRVNSVSELKDGGKYLLIHNNQLMIPTVVTKANSSGSERTGFDLLTTDAFGTDVVLGDYSEYAWTFTADGSKWLLGTSDGYANIGASICTLEEEGSAFTVSGSGSSFNFWSGGYAFNYNSRGLINGYANNPAAFSIYECVEAELTPPDINGDGSLNIIDIQLTARYIALRGEDNTLGDIALMDADGNGVIDQIDLNLISLAVVGQ